MRPLPFAILFFLLAPVSATQLAPSTTTTTSQVAGSPQPCGVAATSRVRTTLYFGLTRPTGSVKDDEWRAFLREQVTPRFPDGLTVWEAEGQWRASNGRIGRERSKVLLLVHDDTPVARETLGQLVASYKRKFEQESVLWESSQVCATF